MKLYEYSNKSDMYYFHKYYEKTSKISFHKFHTKMTFNILFYRN